MKRYQKQIALDKIGVSGQKRLLSSHIIIVGCGGLGSIAAVYLAGAGVGKLTLIDGDYPDVSNLHRQVFYSVSQKRTKKVKALAEHIQSLNGDVEIEIIDNMATKEVMMKRVGVVDAVLECTDNILTKYLVNDVCAYYHTPMVYGAIHKYDGQVSLFRNASEKDVHLRDIFPEPINDIPTCSEVGVLNTLVGIIGLIQANEALKLLLNIGKPLIGELLVFDALNNVQQTIKLHKSWSGDIGEKLANTSYSRHKKCGHLEKSVEEVILNSKNFNIISILEVQEHEEILPKVEHEPLSMMKEEVWSPKNSKPTVFYCLSGRRSLDLVARLVKLNPSLEVYSLSGGLNHVKLIKGEH